MADVYGVQAEKAYTGDPRNKAPNAFFGGFDRNMLDSYEADGLEAESDIRVGELPQGAVIIGGKVVHEAMGAGVTLQVVLTPADGDGDDVALTAAVAAADAGTIDIDDIDDAFQFEVPKKHFIVIRTGGAAATGTLKTRVNYTTIG